MTALPPPVPPRRHKVSEEDAFNPFSDAFKQKLSKHIENQAKRIKGEVIIIGDIIDESDVRNEEREIPMAAPPIPTSESEKESKVDKGRWHFLSRILNGLNKIVKSIKKAKDGETVTTVTNFISSIGKTQKKLPLYTYGREMVKKTITLLEAKKAHEEEGVFRLSGRNTFVNKFIKKFRKQNLDLVEAEKNMVSVHDIAGGLKGIIRDLALLDGVKDKFLEIGGNEKISEAEKVEKLQQLMLELEPENREILMDLLEFLGKVADNHEVSKMSTANLAICMAPNLFKQDSKENSELLDIEAIQKSLYDQKSSAEGFELLLKYRDIIFAEPE